MTRLSAGGEGEMGTTRTNWAGNVTFHAARTHCPASVEELQHLVAGTDRIRALGTGHSFSPIADTSADLVSLAGLPQVRHLDPTASTVTVSAATRYGELAGWLQERGYALRNLASLPHISVAGACATATHGSGDGIGNLATAVCGIQIIEPAGGLVEITREGDADRFDAGVVGLGAMGIVTTLTLEVVPTYDIRQVVYDDLPYRAFWGQVAEVFGSGYSVSLFTDFRDSRFSQVWLKQRIDDAAEPAVEPSFLGAPLADGPRHPVPGVDPVHCTEQGGVPGPWHERLPHFRMDFVPSSGDELQSEYLIPRCLAASALEALDGIAGQIAPVLQVCELRSVAADRLWLSPSYDRDTVGIHFTWVNDMEAVAKVLVAVEWQLEAYDARPHWGKLFAMPPERLAERYPRLAEFRAMRARHDPDGKFGNSFLDQHLAGA
jgi:xylitol oxidase